MHPLVQNRLDRQPETASVLDCGGWFKPLDRATHVVDLMPYETRRYRVQTDPLPGERFRRETWFQVDFLSPEFRLPFADRTFDFAYCSHTLEDLASPFRLLQELARVSRSGVLATPSRLSEQTAGSRDRMSNRLGHPHHHWIIDTHEGRPRFSAKSASVEGSWWRTSLPLRLAEKIQRHDADAVEWVFFRDDKLEWETTPDAETNPLARAFASATGATITGRLTDFIHRSLRRLKYLRRPTDEAITRRSWAEIVELSRPYSPIPLG